MREILATVTQRGQVTIPAEVRRLLGTKTGEKVAFQIDDGQVRLAPATMTLASAFGSVTPLNRPEDFEAIKERALEEKAEEAMLPYIWLGCDFSTTRRKQGADDGHCCTVN